MLNYVIVGFAISLGGYLALSKRLAGSSRRKGTVTSLTSIMGSGFLVSVPQLISDAAIGSQFSAAVGDTEGAGGLIEDITHQRLPARYAYLLILVITVCLTWQTAMNRTIAYASRAFALFYTLQCAVAFLEAWETKTVPHRRFRLVSFAFVGADCLLVFALGLPAE